MVDRANAGFGGERATLAMKLINAHGDVTTRKLWGETTETKTDGQRSKLVFDWPPDVKGTKLLTWSHKQADDDQWLYLPAIKRVRRISGSNKTGSFVGSEFSYEDLGSVELEKFRYRFVDEPNFEGRDTYRIERTPLDRNSAYGRQVVWIDKEYLNPVRIEYYDRSNALLKLATFGGYQKFGRFWRAGSVTMDNVRTKKKSVITWENRQVGISIPAERFDSGRLED